MTNIGIFDSGLGGLTVLKELIKQKNANYFYFGDSLRAPYGNRDEKQIIEFSDQIVNYLENFHIDYYVIACNTMSITSTKFLTDKYKKKFYPITDGGLIGAKNFDGDFLVLGTKKTIDSHFYKNNIEKLTESKVYEIAAVKLVDFIENGIISGDELDDILREYLEVANEKKIANIILACTHYPIIEDSIRKNLAYKANIINPANHFAYILNRNENSSSKIKIIMSKIDKNTKNMIDMVIDRDYQLLTKEL